MTLLGRTIRALGPKRVCSLWGYSLGYCYALARDPADPDHPDNTGTERDPWTRMVALLETLATYPRHRPLLREWEIEARALFDRLLNRDDPDPVTDQVVIERAAACVREHGEAIAAALEAANETGDWSGALREVTEAQAEIDRLAGAVHRRAEEAPAAAGSPQLRRIG